MNLNETLTDSLEFRVTYWIHVITLCQQGTVVYLLPLKFKGEKKRKCFYLNRTTIEVC